MTKEDRISKINQLNKIIYTIIFTAFSSLVFLLKIEVQNMSFYKDYSNIYKFFTEIYLCSSWNIYILLLL